MLEPQTIILERYRVSRLLSRGGMSEVYLAYDEHMHQNVAIKLVDGYCLDNRKRLQREAKALSTLTHEHILPTLAFGEQGPWYYLVMPYVEHGTLRQRLAKGPLTLEEAGNILEQIASALQCAHDRGILHRDIKASNILFANEQHIYLADFGLAKLMGEASDITQEGCLIGTPEYMAPELADDEISPSSDIYALGILLYQMLTGQVPFRGGPPLSVYWKQIKERPVPPSQLNPAVPQAIERVVLCALEKDPRRRFKTPKAMTQAYRRALKAPDQSETARVLAQTAAISSVTYYKLNASTTRPFELSTAPWWQRPQQKVSIGIATVAALLFLFLAPLASGFLLSKDDVQVQTPLFLGASAQFANSKVSNQPLHDHLTSAPQPASTAQYAIINSSIGTRNTAHRVRAYTYPEDYKHKHKQGHRHGRYD